MATDKQVTPEFRGSFVHLITPKRLKGDPNSQAKFQMTLALKPKHKFWKIVDKMIKEACNEKWGKVPPRLKNPKTSGKGSGYENLEKMMTLGLSNTRKPGLVNEDLTPIVDGEGLYSGAWFRASIRAYAWEHPTGGKGVSFSLDNVMFVKDDKAFDGSASAEEDFAKYASDDLLD